MVIQVRPDVERLIDEARANGEYQTVSDVVEEAVKLLIEQQRTERIRHSIDEGVRAVRNGEGRDDSPEFWDDVQARADELDRLGVPISPGVRP
jgi:Arc/MetJ-type ribon-helix-helix transcriptional regulator